ncbi:hypothetical protein Tco_0472804 [Tanacetum coccineum]
MMLGGVLLREKDAEIARLKSLVKEKETESAEVLRLRDQVSVLAADKSLLSAEVSALKSVVSQKDTDISLLDSRASYLKSALDDSQAACGEARNLISSLSSERDGLASEVSTLHSAFRDFKEKMEAQQEEQAQELYNRVAELEAHVMDVSGRLEGEFYPAYLTTLAGRRWLLTHGMELAMVKCLKSPEYQGILGHALGRAVDYGMQEGLAAGYEHGIAGTPLSAVVAYNPETAKNNYLDAVRALEEVDFPLVRLLKSKKDSGMDEVLDCFLLDGPFANLPEAAYLQPCLEQLSVPIYHADVNAVAGETSLSFALLNVHTRAEGAKKHAAALRQLMVDIVSHPLSSQNLLGQASTSAVISCVEDLDTDEDLGSVLDLILCGARSVGKPIYVGMTASVSAVYTIHASCISIAFLPYRVGDAERGKDKARRPSPREGIRQRLDEESRDWIEELPECPMGHRTKIKIDHAKNNVALAINLEHFIEERRSKQRYKGKKQEKRWKIYNSSCRATSIHAGRYGSTAAMKQVMPRRRINLEPKWWDHMKLRSA